MIKCKTEVKELTNMTKVLYTCVWRCTVTTLHN
jgi:hypothetical protein